MPNPLALLKAVYRGGRSGLKQARRHFQTITYRPGTHPDDELGWIVTPEMAARQQQVIGRIWSDLQAGKPLGEALRGFPGREFGERIVEYPYAMQWLARPPRPKAYLDVGCVMNNAVVAGMIHQHCDALWFCNPATEPPAVPPPIYYHVSPLADAFPNGQQFDRVSCLSTLEHVGYDNSQYGSKEPAEFTEPNDAVLGRSLCQLARLVRPGGELLVSVPFGRREVRRHRFTKKLAFQVFDEHSIEEARSALASAGMRAEVTVYAARQDGWYVVQPKAEGLRYGHGMPGAEAVLLIEAVKSSDQAEL